MRLDWVREEFILALDLYMRHGGKVPMAEVRALSEYLQGLPIFPVEQRNPKFRNENGVNAKLMNFRRLDPEQPGVGFTHGADLDAEDLWNQYADDRARLARVAQEIRAANGVPLADVQDVRDSDDAASEEGGLVVAAHRRRERSAALARKKRNAVMAAKGRLVCEACGLDFVERYGADIGIGVAECHHIVPLADSGKTITTLKDLAILCANCHRAVHRLRPMAIDELRLRLT